MHALGRWFRRRWKWIAATLAVLIFLPVIAIQFIVTPLIENKFVSVVESRLKGRLIIGSFTLHLPYNLTAHDCHLIIPNPRTHSDVAVDVQELGITLAQLPLGTGPIVIQDIAIDRPTVHITTTASLMSASSTAPSTEPAPIATPGKLSDILRLRHLAIDNGSFVVQSHEGGETAVMVWTGIGVNIEISPRGEADYAFTLSAKNTPTATFLSDGTFNVDQRSADLAHFSLIANAASGQASQFPVQLQRLLDQYRVHGTLRLDGSAHASALDSSQDSVSTTVSLDHASAYSPELDATLDNLHLAIAASIDRHGVTGAISQFSARSGNADISFQNAPTLSMDSSGRSFMIQGISGVIAADPSTTAAPESHPILRDLSLNGKITFTGHVGADRTHAGNPLDCDLVLASNNAFLYSPRQKLYLTKINMNADLLSDHFQLLGLDCEGLGGKILLDGHVQLAAPHQFTADITTQKADLAQIAALIPRSSDKPPPNVKGIVDLISTLSGQSASNGKTARQWLQGKGQFEIYQGDLWDIPALRRIEDRASVARKALTVGQAAGIFLIADEQVQLQDAAISAPVFGVEGDGTIGFNNQLDLHIIATPLAQLRDEIKKTDIPFLSGLLGDVIGKVQDSISKATGKLLFEFHVTGDANDPQIQTVPSPAISQHGAEIFTNMLHQTDDARPIDLLKQNQN